MKIAKSLIDAIPGFAVLVADHAHRMKEWRAHMQRVNDDLRNGVSGLEQHHPYDRPRSLALVEAAVNEADEVFFEVVDDSSELLAQRKAELIGAVAEAEQRAIATVIPAGKRRLFDLRETEIKQADQARAALMVEQQESPGVLQRLMGKKGDDFDIEAAVVEQRPPDDTTHLLDQEERRRRVAEIEKIAAQAMHDIEDLTPETIGAWTMPTFN